MSSRQDALYLFELWDCEIFPGHVPESWSDIQRVVLARRFHALQQAPMS